jgi:hypothetical protein
MTIEKKIATTICFVLFIDALGSMIEMLYSGQILHKIQAVFMALLFYRQWPG